MNIRTITIVVLGIFLSTACIAQEINDAVISAKVREIEAIRTEKELLKVLSKLESSKSQMDRIFALKYYLMNDDAIAAEKVKIKGLKAFPKGDFATYVEMVRIASLKDIEVKDQEYNKLLAKQPNLDLGMDVMMMTLGFASKGDTAKMEKYLQRYTQFAKDPRGNSISELNMYPMLIKSLLRNHPNLARTYVNRGLDYYRNQVIADNKKEALVRYYQYIDLYAEVLFKENKAEEAFQLLNALKSESTFNKRPMSSVLQASYAKASLLTERYAEIFDSLEKQYVAGENSPMLKNNLTKAYLDKYPKADLQSYFDSLNVVKEEAFYSNIYKKAISEDAPDFELKDVDGNTVKLSDLKGKVVVLDFWATWCGPCKASFPAMQKAVNLYKDDKDVRFLFLHTWEKGTADATVAAKKYITDNNYSFQVLMDLRQGESNESKVAKAYQVRGIPNKIIIDPKGKIRFNTSGSSSDEDRAVKELSEMIEYARKR